MTRRCGGFLPMPPLDRESDEPLHRQIAGRILRAVLSGAVDVGERLPSTRELSRVLGVSRNTAIAAYDELAADGVIEARRGDGSRVASGATGERARDVRRLRRAGCPARTITIDDPDGTALAIRF